MVWCRRISWCPALRPLLRIDVYAMRFRRGIMGRVREGRVLKLEGNPEAASSGGKICGLGQAAVQQHWSPDRLTTPMVRENGALVPATWDKALVLLSGHTGSR